MKYFLLVGMLSINLYITTEKSQIDNNCKALNKCLESKEIIDLVDSFKSQTFFIVDTGMYFCSCSSSYFVGNRKASITNKWISNYSIDALIIYRGQKSDKDFVMGFKNPATGSALFYEFEVCGEELRLKKISRGDF